MKAGKILCRGGIDDQSSVDASEYWAPKPGLLLNMALGSPRNRQLREAGKVGRIGAHVTPTIRGGESGILGGTIKKQAAE